jgi:alpha-methylacyl-CoA racemase
MKDKAGHDIDYLAIGGAFSLMRLPPRVLPIQVANIAGGPLYAALGITAALFGRERTGKE